jgi:hypothetical protein
MQLTSNSITNDFSVEINFTGANLDPDRITEIIGLQPVKVSRAGEPRKADANDLHEEGFWSYETSSNDEITECRDHQLNCLVDTVEPHIDSLRDAGVDRVYFYYTLSSFVGLMNIRFKAETLEKIGRIKADLYVSCFDCFNPQHSFWQTEPQADGQAQA